MIFDSSDSRLALLNQVYAQLLANHLSNSMGPRFSPPPLRPPQTLNPFGLPRPTGGMTASATHGAGWTLGGSDAGHLSLAGQTGAASAPIPMPPAAQGTGPVGAPRFSPPAMRPPAGIGPLPH